MRGLRKKPANRRLGGIERGLAPQYHWYATYLQSGRRFDESLIEIDRAQALDPNSASILADKGMLLWRAGHHEQALRLLRQLEESDPEAVSPHRYLKFAYVETGEWGFCGLEFELAWVEFYKTERSVGTTRAEQVRQPIFREGLFQWRNYEPWLTPL